MAQSKHFGVFAKDGQEDRVAATPHDAVDMAWNGWALKKAATATTEDAEKLAAGTGTGDVAGDSTSTEASTRSTTTTRK